jgi:acetyl-CoA acetyltransferase
MPAEKEEIVVLPDARTPFGRFGGSLKDLTATDLGVIAARGALDRSGVNPAEIDHVIFGNAQQTATDSGDPKGSRRTVAAISGR